LSAPPSPFFLAHAEAIRDAARLGPVLDLACGRGRHAIATAELGVPVLAIDRDPDALAALRRAARERGLTRAGGLRADLETQHGIPVRSESCGAVLVFRFLFRPLARAIVDVLAPGGLLLYETFTQKQRTLGHGPRNPAFLLGPGELPELFCALEIECAWEGLTAGAPPEALARLVARRRRAGTR
jgi:SAM-dependent methyltransferase